MDKKLNETHKRIGVGVIIVVAIVLLGSFVVDLGINSKYFIERDFEKISDYVVTGNCDGYMDYTGDLPFDNFCIKTQDLVEDENGIYGIASWELDNISYDRFDSVAYLKTTLTAKTEDGDVSLPKQFTLERDNFRWK